MEFVLWFNEISKEDINMAGGKGANLGEMYNLKLPVPPGFVVTSDAYKYFLERNGIDKEIYRILDGLDIDNPQAIMNASEKIQRIILNTEVPDEIKSEIIENYDNLNIDEGLKNLNGSALSLVKAGKDPAFVAVRSSATAEDLPNASFAGQQASFLNIRGNKNVIEAVKKCWASLFTARAIFYRVKNNFEHDKVFIAVVIQRMVDSDKSGVMFTVNPSTNEDEILIEAGFGLGEAIVGGEITPDSYRVDKDSLKIKEIKVNKQEWMYTRDEVTGNTIKKELYEEDKDLQVLNKEEILKLSEYAKLIEEHYGSAQDIEWAIEGNRVFIVQSRAITTIEKVKEKLLERVSTKKEIKGEVILDGLGASPGISSGKVKIVHSIDEVNKIEMGDILVTKMTNPDFVTVMKIASAIVTDSGGITSHAAIVSRELGIPCVVGTLKATEILQDNEVITVNGDNGKVYKGDVKEVEDKEIIGDYEEEYKEIPITGTKIYMNLGEPEKIDDYKNLDFDGIGLMRIEFIISSYIKKHPNYLIEKGEEEEYVNELAEGIEKVASSVNGKVVVVRFSDFKTNEYRNLEGGSKYEPEESNPMIGWRGVSRYVSKDFKEAFKLECKAIKKVRENCENVYVMLPFVRNVDEVKECLKIMKEEELERSEKFKIWLMAEVPSIALIPEEFAKLEIDGVSIGSNDLTQLVLGVDRDSAILGRMGYFDERNSAVLVAIKRIINGFKKYGKSVSICGQAPSEYNEIVEFLVKSKIDSISVNPDVVNKVRRVVASVERKILLENF